MAKSRENITNMDIILLFLGKPVYRHGITVVHITYSPVVSFFIRPTLHKVPFYRGNDLFCNQNRFKVYQANEFKYQNIV